MKATKKLVLAIKRSDPELGADSINKTLYLNPDFSITEYNDRVIFTPQMCSYMLSQYGKFVKISTNNNKIRIYRRCTGRSSKEFMDDMAALTYSSLKELGVNNTRNDIEIMINKGSWFSFYWYHPFHATRIAMRVGIYSLIVGVISVVLSVIGIVISLGII